MSKISLLIVCESQDGSKALPVARIDDHELLVDAARSAILSKLRQAADLKAVDRNLGIIASEEAARLERTLTALIPEISGSLATNNTQPGAPTRRM